jgi:UDP-GlcNAc:undecaprenyl-phosphate/decaprenyl-phosphate GlcNAc-1-phosphate transferase
MTTVSYFALIFAATLWLSRFLLRYMEPDMFMDEPSDRKIHTHAKPRFGGIAFGLAIIIIGWFLLNDQTRYTWFFLGAISMFVLGAIDDYWSISWRYKLPSQILIGFMIAVQFIGQIESLSFFGVTLTSNPYVMVALFLFWFVGIVNSVNLIDGLDGLAGGYMFLTSFFALVIGWLTDNKDFIYFNTLFMGAMAAFLHFNQKPAQFFMGDSGSLLLGFHVASMPLLFAATKNIMSTSELNMTPFILLSSYLIIDTARVFYDRLRVKSHPLEPDQTHLHHLLLKQTGSYKGTLLTIFLYLSIFGSVAIVSVFSTPDTRVMIMYLVVLCGLVFISRITDFGLNIVTKIIYQFSWDEEHLPGYQTLIRVKFLPIVTLIYYGTILGLAMGGIKSMSTTPLLIASLFLILLFTVRSTVLQHNTEIFLIGLGIIQVLILDIIYKAIPTGILSVNSEIAVQLLRYMILAIITVIAVVNYLMRSKRLGSDFWRITDLLVLFILLGLASIKTLGVGISTPMAFELGIIYLANKLSAPRLLSWFQERSEKLYGLSATD